jgi:hypothetical protein
MFIKRTMVGLLGLAIAQLLMMGCEKSDGPDPWLCQHTFNQVIPMSKADGSKALGPGLPFDKLDRLIINDTSLIVCYTLDTIRDPVTDTIKETKPSLDWVEYAAPIDMGTVGKIVFKP